LNQFSSPEIERTTYEPDIPAPKPQFKWPFKVIHNEKPMKDYIHEI